MWLFGLYRDVAKNELNLLQFAAVHVKSTCFTDCSSLTRHSDPDDRRWLQFEPVALEATGDENKANPQR